MKIPSINRLKPINSTLLALLVAVFFTLIINVKIFQTYLANHSIDSISSVLQMAFFVLFIYLLMFAILSLFNFRNIQKFIYIVFLLISAPSLYFSLKFNVLFDQSMLRNLVETDVKEAADLLTPSFWLVVILVGILPSILLWKLPVVYSRYWKRISLNLLQAIGALVLAIASTYPYYGELSSFIRSNNTKLKYSFLPYAPVNSFYKNIQDNFQDGKIIKEIIDPDARVISSSLLSKTKPLALVIIIGETAREKSFGFHGSTNNQNNDSLLTRSNLVYFDNFYSCGTNTIASVPCMFSTFSKENFKRSYNQQYENVAEIIQRVGYEVVWRNNNSSSCKGICLNLINDPVTEKNSKKYYHHNEFFDEALVDDLASRISKKQTDQVIFLHQLGSHGPAYYKRIPEQFKTQQPACESADFGNCTDSEIANAYDNSVGYSKYVINRAITELEKISDDYNTVLIYSSDHGESTGEDGYYLHGLPYFMAPDEQIHIPYLIWFSDNFIQSRGVDVNCMNNKSSQRFNHDNFSHTLLGILDIKSKVYAPDLDLLATCRNR